MASRELLRIDPDKRSIIERHLSQVPVRLGELARELGVSAIKVSSMRTGVSGQVAREGDEYIIRVNRNEARERQRFTIAHELAHYLLHRNLIDTSSEGITDTVLYRSGAPEQVEFEANRLAADIVMPSALVDDMLKSEYQGIVTEATIENLAARFGVSKAAMELRLERMARA
ncbi:ImmA/IrrE family metallo-endopeptidase [Methylobacterium sp. Leaf399]|uniref:ImmA/IrrE family metallo-endopeptidase n=1 Tax=Methylobacterium sp. Leaf399 TaxID=1736364 RepID=UPI0009E70009|nr:ImmA/IrrE family metallo-endopeptidase [Methylobacterium sp. Leaf399]